MIRNLQSLSAFVPTYIAPAFLRSSLATARGFGSKKYSLSQHSQDSSGFSMAKHV